MALYLYEDLFSLGRSAKLVERVSSAREVVNTRNLVKGKTGRRGDGTLGELIPGEKAERIPGFSVARGPVATIEIGVEVKILATAMIKQIDRVINDLRHQSTVFKSLNSKAITVGIVGVNYSYSYVSYEKDRQYPSSPIAESRKAQQRLEAGARKAFDEFLVIPFGITNVEPFPFEWIDKRDIEQHYNSVILRISNLYDARF
ncbi:MAG: hypothetical protein ACREMS_13360 [Gemmatimonadaceae bacterium]